MIVNQRYEPAFRGFPRKLSMVVADFLFSFHDGIFFFQTLKSCISGTIYGTNMSGGWLKSYGGQPDHLKVAREIPVHETPLISET